MNPFLPSITRDSDCWRATQVSSQRGAQSMAYRPVQTPESDTAAPGLKPPFRGSPWGRRVADSIAVGSAVGAFTLSVLPSDAHVSSLAQLLAQTAVHI